MLEMDGLGGANANGMLLGGVSDLEFDDRASDFKPSVASME